MNGDAKVHKFPIKRTVSSLNHAGELLWEKKATKLNV